MSEPVRKKLLFIITGGTLDAEPYDDPEHPPKTATMPEDYYSRAAGAIRRMMKRDGMQEGVDYDVMRWKMEDSSKFTDKDMKHLAQIVATAEANRIVITHGTTCMVQNAKLLQQELDALDIQKGLDAQNALRLKEELDALDLHKDQDARDALRLQKKLDVLEKNLAHYSGAPKAVAFTGAMIPLSNGEKTDGIKNLETAIKVTTRLEYNGPFKSIVRIAFAGKMFDPAHTEKIEIKGELPYFESQYTLAI